MGKTGGLKKKSEPQGVGGGGPFLVNKRKGTGTSGRGGIPSPKMKMTWGKGGLLEKGMFYRHESGRWGRV